MTFNINKLISGFRTNYQRLSNGSHYYENANSASWDDLNDKLKIGYSNPVLLPILQITSHYVSKAEFFIEKADGTRTNEHDLVSLLNNPNHYQSKQDFLTQFVWFKYCFGYNYLLPFAPVGFKTPKDTKAIYNLNAALIEFPDNFKTPFVFDEAEAKDIKQSEFIYDKDGQNLKIETQKIIPFFDLANGIESANLLTAPSRLNAFKKPLSNISKAFEAKNIILQSNGKELFTNESAGNVQAMPLTNTEKTDIENKFNKGFGLSMNRSRSVVTNAAIKWQSLHINLADLGLDESVIRDAKILTNGFNIPSELISFDGKGAKYENQVQATIAFIQTVIQDIVDDIANSITSFYQLEEGKLVASLDHLPIMQEVENKKADTVKKKAEALKALLDAGVAEEDALQLLNMKDVTIKPKTNEGTNIEN